MRQSVLTLVAMLALLAGCSGLMSARGPTYRKDLERWAKAVSDQQPATHEFYIGTNYFAVATYEVTRCADGSLTYDLSAHGKGFYVLPMRTWVGTIRDAADVIAEAERNMK